MHLGEFLLASVKQREPCMTVNFPFLTRECESSERVIAFGGQISLARWAVNFNLAINLCILIYSFTIQLI